MENKKNNDYKKMIRLAGIYDSGFAKGTFIFPPNGLILWKNIENLWQKKLDFLGVRNVLLPTFIPINLLEKEQKHIIGFKPEIFWVNYEEDEKKKMCLRPTSEVLFYEWCKKQLESYRQLPLLFNQWCSVFRKEKNTSPFMRNTEFYWQEGHTFHKSEEDARVFLNKIINFYRWLIVKKLGLAVLEGKKSEKEKFAGAQETYSFECLLKDGQCLQVATAHYFHDNFSRSFDVNFLNEKKERTFPFTTSWGFSTRLLGAISKTYQDDWGIFFPPSVSPIQIALIAFNEEKEAQDLILKIFKNLNKKFRCCIYDKHQQNYQNIQKADQDGCPLKIIVGKEEIKEKKITLVFREEKKKKISFALSSEWKKELNKKIVFLFREFQKKILYNNRLFLSENIHSISNLEDFKIKKGIFLIWFCKNILCEEKIKKTFSSYSIRCIKRRIFKKKSPCFVCHNLTKFKVFLGRSY